MFSFQPAPRLRGQNFFRSLFCINHSVPGFNPHSAIRNPKSIQAPFGLGMGGIVHFHQMVEGQVGVFLGG